MVAGQGLIANSLTNVLLLVKNLICVENVMEQLDNANHVTVDLAFLIAYPLNNVLLLANLKISIHATGQVLLQHVLRMIMQHRIRKVVSLNATRLRMESVILPIMHV